MKIVCCNNNSPHYNIFLVPDQLECEFSTWIQLYLHYMWDYKINSSDIFVFFHKDYVE